MKLRSLVCSMIPFLLLSASCANTATASEADGEDVPSVHGGFVSDAGASVADVPVQADVPSAPIRVTVGSDTPAGRGIPYNATGVRALTYHIASTGEEVRMHGLWVRMGGSLPTEDVGNAYLLAVPRLSVAGSKYRYVTGRAVNPETHEFFVPDDGTIRAGGVTTSTIVLDFGRATPDRTFSLEIAAVVLHDRTVVVSGAQGDAFHVAREPAPRIDVTVGPVPAPIRANVASQTIGTFGLATDRDGPEFAGNSLINTGSVTGWRDIHDLEFWVAGQRQEVVEWTDQLFNDRVRFALAPSSRMRLRPNVSYACEVRARVDAPPGQTVRLSAEYPVDIFAQGDVAVCIASTAIGGCSAPGQGSFDGDGANANTVTVVP